MPHLLPAAIVISLAIGCAAGCACRGLRSWLGRLLDRTDVAVDLLTMLVVVWLVVSLAALAELFFLEAYDVYILHHEFHGMDFGGAFGSISTATGVTAILHMFKWPGSGSPPGGGTPS